MSTQNTIDIEKRNLVIKAWGQAEKMTGVFVNLDERTISKFMKRPADSLAVSMARSIRSNLSRR